MRRACHAWLHQEIGDSYKLLGGGLLIGLLAVARYLDLFESLIARALVFFVVGAALFALGILWRRRPPIGTQRAAA